MGGALSSATGPTAADLGHLLLERYEVGGLFDEGAYGLLYSCRRRDAGVEEEEKEELALKVVDKAQSDPFEASERGAREAEMLKALDHPNIVRLRDAFFDGPFVCIVMDKYAGGNLLQGLHSYHLQHGFLEPPRAAQLLLQAALAVQHLHRRQIVHRDVKGDNLLVDRSDIGDPDCRVVLADFDVAVRLGPDERLTPERNGTEAYWAPERFPDDSTPPTEGGHQHREGYGHKVDVWALGVVLYMLICGKFPFRGEAQIKSRAPRLPKRLHADCAGLLEAAMEKVEASRLSSDDLVAHRWLRDAKQPSDGDSTGTETTAVPDEPSPSDCDLAGEKRRP